MVSSYEKREKQKERKEKRRALHVCTLCLACLYAIHCESVLCLHAVHCAQVNVLHSIKYFQVFAEIPTPTPRAGRVRAERADPRRRPGHTRVRLAPTKKPRGKAVDGGRDPPINFA